MKHGPRLADIRSLLSHIRMAQLLAAGVFAQLKSTDAKLSGEPVPISVIQPASDGNYAKAVAGAIAVAARQAEVNAAEARALDMSIGTSTASSTVLPPVVPPNELKNRVLKALDKKKADVKAAIDTIEGKQLPSPPPNDAKNAAAVAEPKNWYSITPVAPKVITALITHYPRAAMLVAELMKRFKTTYNAFRNTIYLDGDKLYKSFTSAFCTELPTPLVHKVRQWMIKRPNATAAHLLQATKSAVESIDELKGMVVNTTNVTSKADRQAFPRNQNVFMTDVYGLVEYILTKVAAKGDDFAAVVMSWPPDMTECSSHGASLTFIELAMVRPVLSCGNPTCDKPHHDRVCVGCQLEQYCSSECQTAHSDAHQRVCPRAVGIQRVIYELLFEECPPICMLPKITAVAGMTFVLPSLRPSGGEKKLAAYYQTMVARIERIAAKRRAQ